ncbi:hypothetical protein BpHYR1_034109 [Brachionus plicatilis]|uniref:Uncharacterized protein n=1 Tax=Brachionus plicatilis TaxID=10195 RepID=A0A3M7PK54_BRAPC|nr:hypothetical protein BpHYR1_034109 [Brachionus plicatilis]
MVSYAHRGSCTSVYFCGPVSLSNEDLMQVLLNSRSCSLFQRLQMVHGFCVPDYVKDPFSILDDPSIPLEDTWSPLLGVFFPLYNRSLPIL